MQPNLPTPDSAFEQASQLYRTGQLAAAESILRQIVAAHPEHFDAWLTLGAMLMLQNRLADAADVYRRFVVAHPNSADAHYNLGAASAMLGQYEPATHAFLTVTHLRPDWAAAFSNLGNAHSGANRMAEAEQAYRRAVELDPALAAAWANLGTLLHRTERAEAALVALDKSLELRPDHPETLFNRAHALKNAGRVEEAIATLQRINQLRPDYWEAWHSLAMFQGSLLRYDEALTSVNRCTTLQPNNPGGHNTLGLLLRDQGKREESLSAFQRSLELDPNFLQGYVNAGMMFHELGRVAEAIAMQREAVRRNPVSVEAHLNLGNALRDAGEWQQAIDTYRIATRLSPAASHHLLLALHYVPGLDPLNIVAEHRKWAATSASIKPITPANDFDPNRRLRVGFVSADFRRHAVGYNLLPLFDHLDRQNFEVFIYSTATQPDDLTEHFRKQADHWIQISALSDARAAEKIAADRIDILIDLSLHSGGGRLEIFAYKPAPLAGTFAGYPSTTGLSQVDFRLSDPYLDPPGMNDAFYSERTVRLEKSFWCFRPAEDSPQVNALPASTNGFITMGYLGSFGKVNQPTLALWARVMRNLPTSRLLMICRPGGHRDPTIAFLQSQGIAPARVDFVDYQTRGNYLKLYHRIDLSLDSFPYNSHTTGLEGLWMGVPTVSKIGAWAVSRAGYSQLTNLGLPDLIANDDDAFVTVATKLADDLPRLTRLRENLRSMMQQSPLMDEGGWANNIQQTLRNLWRERCEVSRR